MFVAVLLIIAKNGKTQILVFDGFTNKPYLEKNHFASGRQPSEEGYKYYVENLMAPKDLTGEDMLKLQTIFKNNSLDLNDTIRKLKDAGLWVIGTDGSAKTMYYNQDLKGPLAIIIGSEGFGMSKLVKENADILIKIPMKGKITSLNASVSAGIVIYEAVKQRG